jgi:hypothetical protein
MFDRITNIFGRPETETNEILGGGPRQEGGGAQGVGWGGASGAPSCPPHHPPHRGKGYHRGGVGGGGRPGSWISENPDTRSNDVGPDIGLVLDPTVLVLDPVVLVLHPEDIILIVFREKVFEYIFSQGIKERRHARGGRGGREGGGAFY